MVSPLTFLPFTRTRVTALGCSIRLISCLMLFKRIIRRDTLIPPPVDPAQAPTTIRERRMALENSGHRFQSAVQNPVVVMMAATWKEAYLNACSTLPY